MRAISRSRICKGDEGAGRLRIYKFCWEAGSAIGRREGAALVAGLVEGATAAGRRRGWWRSCPLQGMRRRMPVHLRSCQRVLLRWWGLFGND
jgi:hypothetical protein